MNEAKRIAKMKEGLLEHAKYSVDAGFDIEKIKTGKIEEVLSETAIIGLSWLEKNTGVDKESWCYELWELYREKNNKYGNSFGETYEAFGVTVLRVRVYDKLKRYFKITQELEIATEDESLIDTVGDMVNYCIMGLMELEDDRI